MPSGADHKCSFNLTIYDPAAFIPLHGLEMLPEQPSAAAQNKVIVEFRTPDAVAHRASIPGNDFCPKLCPCTFALHMAKNYGVKVKAYNISHEQIMSACEQAKAEGLNNAVDARFAHKKGTCDRQVPL